MPASNAAAIFARDPRYRDQIEAHQRADVLRRAREITEMKRDTRRDQRRQEQDLQRAIIKLLETTGAGRRCIVFHPPNGGARRRVEAAILKGMGVVPGVADLIFILPGGIAKALELKSEEGRLSDHQLRWGARMKELRADYAVARTLDEAVEILTAWGIL